MRGSAVAAHPAVAVGDPPPNLAAPLSGLIPLNRRERFAPGPGAVINRSHPLSVKLVLAVPTHPVVDLVKRRMSTQTGDLVRGRSSSYGPSGKCSTSPSGDGIPNALTTDLDFTSGGFTILALGSFNTAGGANYPFALNRSTYTSESSNSGWAFQHRLTDGWSFQTYNNNGFGLYGLNQGVDEAGGSFFVAGTSDGTTKRLYVNGRQVASSTNSPNPGTSAGVLRFGFENSASGLIGLSSAFAWARCLSANEIATLYADPFCFFRF